MPCIRLQSTPKKTAPHNAPLSQVGKFKSRKSCAPTKKPHVLVGAQLLGDTDWQAAQVLPVKSIRAKVALLQKNRHVLVGAQLLGDTDWQAAQVLPVKSIRAKVALLQKTGTYLLEPSFWAIRIGRRLRCCRLNLFAQKLRSYKKTGTYLLEPSFWAMRTLKPTQALPVKFIRAKVALLQKNRHVLVGAQLLGDADSKANSGAAG